MQRLIEHPQDLTAGVSACRDVVVLLGAPGSGKGTQARALAEAHGARHISSGDLLRAHRDRETAPGREAQAAMERGALVPDELVTQMVLAELQHTPPSRLALLDGFPRTLAQAMALDVAVKEHGGRLRSAISVDERQRLFEINLDALDHHPAAVVNLQVPSPVLVRRLSGRRVCSACGASYPEPERQA